MSETMKLFSFVVDDEIAGKLPDSEIATGKQTADTLRGYRIDVEYVANPFNQFDPTRDPLPLVHWILRPALQLIRGNCSAEDIEAEGYEFRMFDPAGILIIDTLDEDRWPPHA